MSRLFGTNGIRGIPGKDLTPELVISVSRAVCYIYGGKIALGRDGRKTSSMLRDLVAASVLESGCDVVDLGILPTPALQYYVSRGGFDAAIMITASHNPPEFNGLKVMGANGFEIPRKEEERIEKFVLDKKDSRHDTAPPGSLMHDERALDTYVKGILSHVEKESISSKHFRVVIDAGNGMQALAAPKLLTHLGCEVKCINCEVNGDFLGRGPEPIPSKLAQLAEETAEGYDIGVAFDGDGDRSVFCDDSGKVLTGDVSGSFLVKYILERIGRNKIVTTIATSSLADWAVSFTRSELIRTRVGSVDVTERMLKVGAVAGFEENGGFFYMPHQPVRDGAMTLALMLSALHHYGKPLSSLISEMPKYYQAKGKLACPNEFKHYLIRRLAEEAEGKKDTTDGVKLFEKDGSWVLIRASGTEPLIRVFAESREESRAVELYKKYIKKVEEIVESLRKT